MVLKAFLIAILAVGVFAGDFKLSGVLDRKPLKASEYSNCENFHPGDEFNKFVDTANIIVTCIREVMNTEIIENEVEEAKAKGTLGKLFKTYCESKPRVNTCVKNLFEKLKPCVKPSYVDSINASEKVARALLAFACKNDGEVLSSFISSNGTECFLRHIFLIAACPENQTFAHTLNSDEISVEKKCTEYDKLTSCIVTALQSCEKQTASTTMDSLFKTLRNASPCNA